MTETAEHWDLTPAELFRCFRFVRTGQSINLEVKPFTGLLHPLDGTPFQYQMGLSSTSVALDVRAIRTVSPGLQASGDKRSGILIYDGPKIIGSYVIPGDYTRDHHRLIVHPEYRGQGLSTRMVEQWYRLTPHAYAISKQPINVKSVRAFLSAHRNVITWAIKAKKDVPQKVIDAVTRGAEAGAILREAGIIERQPV